MADIRIPTKWIKTINAWINSGPYIQADVEAITLRDRGNRVVQIKRIFRPGGSEEHLDELEFTLNPNDKD